MRHRRTLSVLAVALASTFLTINATVGAVVAGGIAGPGTVTQSARRQGNQTTTRSPGRLALDVLDTIVVENENPSGYNRDLFGYPTTFGYGCDTRDRVLIRDSLTPAQVDPYGCAVIVGDWYSTYDNATATNPGDLQIDHVVALKEAWDSGAWSWTPAQRLAFGNDIDDRRTLRAVTSAVNQAKSANDPSNWIPPYDGAVCGYLADWVVIKARWSLTMDRSEHGRIRNLLTSRCPQHPVQPWEQTSTKRPPRPQPPTTQPPSTQPPTTQPPRSGCDPSYPTVCIPPPPPDLDCGEITFRRFVVLQPDPHRFDADKDGIGCES